MIRRPPRSTLFPTRRSSDLMSGLMEATGEPDGAPTVVGEAVSDVVAGLFASWATLARSEEHTSELQSQSNLVCRLLLEKKKHLARQRRVGVPLTSVACAQGG